MFFLRMRDSYKSFVKTWIRFCESMDSFCIVVTNPDSKKIRFVLWLTNPDSFRIVDHKSFMFSKDSFRRLIFKRFACFYEYNESLQILSTIARNESLKIEIRESESLRILQIRIRESGFVTPNLKDLYRGFVLWIRFVDSFLKDSFHGNGFVSCKQKSQITWFVSICKDSYTNPASLVFLNLNIETFTYVSYKRFLLSLY